MLDNKRNYIKLLNLCNLNPIDLSVKFPFDHITRHLDNLKHLDNLQRNVPHLGTSESEVRVENSFYFIFLLVDDWSLTLENPSWEYDRVSYQLKYIDNTLITYRIMKMQWWNVHSTQYLSIYLNPFVKFSTSDTRLSKSIELGPRYVTQKDLSHNS